MNSEAKSNTSEPFGPYEVRQDSRAMLRLTLGSACTIATLLLIPDSIAILPDSPNPGTWLLRLFGLWLSAFVLWSLSFFALLHLVRLASGSIVLNSEGLKLWRLGKLIKWSNIKAVGVEPQPFFSRAFFLGPTVKRLSVYEEKPPGGSTAQRNTPQGVKLVPHYIPSFYYSAAEFESLVGHICEQSCALVPDAAHVLIGDTEQREALRKIYERGRMQRVLLSAFIALSLITFLGRKAALNYAFNAGNKAYRQEDYAQAEQHYRLATTIDQTFAAAWDRLARSEYRQGRVQPAFEHWQKALVMKPDFVEAKIALSNIYVQHRDFARGKQLLEQAIRLAPHHAPAYVNLADLYVRLGDYERAEQLASSILKKDPTNDKARCLIVRTKVRLGETQAARRVMDEDPARAAQLRSHPFCLLVLAELKMAQGDFAAAEQLMKSLQQLNPEAEDLMLDFARLRLKQGRTADAEKFISQAVKVAAKDPWPLIMLAEASLQKGDTAYARQCLERAQLDCQPDPLSSQTCAKLLSSIGDKL